MLARLWLRGSGRFRVAGLIGGGPDGMEEQRRGRAGLGQELLAPLPAPLNLGVLVDRLRFLEIWFRRRLLRRLPAQGLACFLELAMGE